MDAPTDGRRRKSTIASVLRGGAWFRSPRQVRIQEVGVANLTALERSREDSPFLDTIKVLYPRLLPREFPGRLVYHSCLVDVSRETIQLRHHVRVQGGRLREGAAAEAQPHHRVALRPVVAVVDVEPGEQLLASSLPAKNSFSVSRNRLLPNRRGRYRK